MVRGPIPSVDILFIVKLVGVNAACILLSSLSNINPLVERESVYPPSSVIVISELVLELLPPLPFNNCFKLVNSLLFNVAELSPVPRDNVSLTVKLPPITIELFDTFGRILLTLIVPAFSDVSIIEVNLINCSAVSEP